MKNKVWNQNKPYFNFFNLSNPKYTTTPITLFPYCSGTKPTKVNILFQNQILEIH